VAGKFTKVGKRKSLAISILNCAVVVNGESFTAKIALGSVGPFPFRAIKAEEAFKETRSSVKTSEIAAKEATPITDVRASAWYRKRITGVIVERALNACLAELRGEQS
jgi:CO/xanthine dehydrogenase FAD-binding subunit